MVDTIAALFVIYFKSLSYICFLLIWITVYYFTHVFKEGVYTFPYYKHGYTATLLDVQTKGVETLKPLHIRML